MKLLALLFIFSECTWAQITYVPPAKLLKKKGYQFGATVDSWSTSKILDSKGKEEVDPFITDTTFSRVQAEAAGYYGATSDLQFGFGVRYRQNSSSFTVQSEEINATGTGVESTFASVKFAFQPVNKLQYTLEGMFRFRPYTSKEIDLAADPDLSVLSLGDEGSEMSGGMVVTYSGTERKFFSVRGGYRKAGEHISDELYWQLEAAKAWDRVALIAGVDGVSSMSNDPYGDDQTKRPGFLFGATNLYNTENREFVAPYLGLNVAIGKAWRIELKGTQVVVGKSTDLGTGFSFSLLRREDSTSTRLIDSKFKEYDLETSVTKVSPQQNYVVIDKGLADDVQKGMKFDFFEFDYVGGNVLVATGVVLQTKSDSSVVKITQRYNKKELKSGIIGRASLK